MWYRITPNDTLFFRDGKPFTMGAESWADIIFPPNPSTLYGAIRTWLIFEKGDLKSFIEGKFREELGTPNEKGKLRIKGPILFKNGEFLFPLPLDLLKREGNENNNVLSYLTFSRKPDILISDYKMDNSLIWKDTEHAESVEGYISAIYLKNYLSGEGNLGFTEAGDLYIVETKIGIARDRVTRTAKWGHIYRAPMIRLKEGVSIAVWIDGITNIPESGLLQLGGEKKSAKIEKVNDNILEEIENINLQLDNGLFKVYLATPSIFENGYLPGWIDPNTFEGSYNRIKVKLVCCVIGKYRLIGGWDMAKGKPKPMVRAVPAGSVYYFQILDNPSFDRIKETFHFKNISDRYPEEGYGLSLIGVVRL